MTEISREEIQKCLDKWNREAKLYYDLMNREEPEDVSIIRAVLEDRLNQIDKVNVSFPGDEKLQRVEYNDCDIMGYDEGFKYFNNILSDYERENSNLPLGDYFARAFVLRGKGLRVVVKGDDKRLRRPKIVAVDWKEIAEESVKLIRSTPIYVTKDGVWLNIRPDASLGISVGHGGAMFKIEGDEAEVLKRKFKEIESFIAKYEKAKEK